MLNVSAPPVATLAPPCGRRWYWHREKAHVQIEVNKRKDRIRKDKLLRHGQEDLPRRSQFTEW